jgi:hypothetical protein
VQGAGEGGLALSPKCHPIKPTTWR